MIELGAGTLSLIFLAAIMVGIMAGFHIALVLVGVSSIIGYFILGPEVYYLIYMRASHMLLNYNMLAIPLFTFMGVVLSKSLIAEKLYRGLYLWMGWLNGGLALSTVVLGTILAAGLGVVQASVSMLTMISLGPMVNRGYGKDFASGAICAGGTLGILIPPSIMLVILGMMASLSIGKLFFGAFFPGLVLSGLYLTYILVRSWLQPGIAPAAPPEERNIPFMQKLTLLVTSILPPPWQSSFRCWGQFSLASPPSMRQPASVPPLLCWPP